MRFLSQSSQSSPSLIVQTQKGLSTVSICWNSLKQALPLLVLATTSADLYLWMTNDRGQTTSSIETAVSAESTLDTSDSIQLPAAIEADPQTLKTPPPSAPLRWNYQGSLGPNQWGHLEGAETCDLGEEQSPIAIETGANAGFKNSDINTSLPALNPKWIPSSFKILNNGHTIEMSYDPGSTIEFDGESYQLKQFHFHSPSEHIIDGKQYPMEVHFVHASSHPETPKTLVIGALFETGFENLTLQKIWNHLPSIAGTTPIHFENLEINAMDFLPVSPSYYHYQGSFTSPPCTEGVSWFIYDQPIYASESQFQTIQKILKGPNSRPLQPLNGRNIQKATQIF